MSTQTHTSRRRVRASAEAVQPAAQPTTTEEKTVVVDEVKPVEPKVEETPAAEESAASGAAPAEDPKAEEPPATSHPQMCDATLFGTYDANNDICRDCCKEFPECGEACQALLAYNNRNKPAAAGKAKTAGVAKPKTGPVSKFSQSYLTMQNGKIDTSLETPKSLEAHATDTGTSVARVKSHVAWLEKNRPAVCKKVVADGKIHFELITATA